MKSIQFNSIGGASGDMILGALIGLGADPGQLNSVLASLMPDEHYSIQVSPCVENSISGLRATVEIADTTHHHHAHAHDTGIHHHHHPHQHRNLPEIKSIILRSSLPDKVKDMSIEVFTRLARAEAQVHATTIDQIHFHEVGAVDSIVDITGCCLALHMLGVESVGVGPLPLGCGSVECQHGILPVPAPATAILLQNMDTVQTDEPFELVTPTGAALLSTWKQPSIPAGKIIASANSFGQRELHKRPNLLRAILFDKQPEPGIETRTVIECNIDDCQPQLLGSLFDRLLQAGACEVFTIPALMKKQRQGTLLSVISPLELVTTLEDIIFSETTTIGLRRYEVTRRVLPRRQCTVNTPYGHINVKIASLNGQDITFSPEYDDCRRAAELHKIPVRKVCAAAIDAMNHKEEHDRS